MSKRAAKKAKQAEEKKAYKPLKAPEEQPVRKAMEKKGSVKEEMPYEEKGLSKFEQDTLSELPKEVAMEVPVTPQEETNAEEFSFTISDLSPQIMEEDMEVLFLTNGFSVKARIQPSSDEKFLCCISCVDRVAAKKAKDEILGMSMKNCKFEIRDDQVYAIGDEQIDSEGVQGEEKTTNPEEKSKEENSKIEEESKTHTISDSLLAQEKENTVVPDKDIEIQHSGNAEIAEKHVVMESSYEVIADTQTINISERDITIESSNVIVGHSEIREIAVKDDTIESSSEVVEYTENKETVVKDGVTIESLSEVIKYTENKETVAKDGVTIESLSEVVEYTENKETVVKDGVRIESLSEVIEYTENKETVVRDGAIESSNGVTEYSNNYGEHKDHVDEHQNLVENLETIEEKEGIEKSLFESVKIQEESKDGEFEAEETKSHENKLRENTEIGEEKKIHEELKQNRTEVEGIDEIIEKIHINDDAVTEKLKEENANRMEIVKSDDKEIQNIIDSIILEEIAEPHQEEIKEVIEKAIKSSGEVSGNYSDANTIEYITVDSPEESNENKVHSEIHLLEKSELNLELLGSESIKDSLGSYEIINSTESRQKLTQSEEILPENEEFSIKQYIEYTEVDVDSERTYKHTTYVHETIEILNVVPTNFQESKYEAAIIKLGEEEEEEEKLSVYDPANIIHEKDVHTPEFNKSHTDPSHESSFPEVLNFPNPIDPTQIPPKKANTPNNSSYLIYAGTTVVILVLSFLLLKKFRH